MYFPYKLFPPPPFYASTVYPTGLGMKINIQALKYVCKFQGAEIYKLRIVLGHNRSFADSASILRLKISRDNHGHNIAE